MSRLVVYKYPLGISDYTVLDLPSGARLLHADVQGGGGMMLWALVDPDQPAEPRRIAILGTGHAVKVLDGDRLQHINTFLVDGGAFVFHAFEVLPS